MAKDDVYPNNDMNPLDEQVGGSHYKNFKIQPVEFITTNNLSFLEGSVIKRVCRHRNKNKEEDIRKAIHELELILELEYGKDKKEDAKKRKEIKERQEYSRLKEKYECR